MLYALILTELETTRGIMPQNTACCTFSARLRIACAPPSAQVMLCEINASPAVAEQVSAPPPFKTRLPLDYHCSSGVNSRYCSAGYVCTVTSPRKIRGQRAFGVSQLMPKLVRDLIDLAIDAPLPAFGEEEVNPCNISRFTPGLGL
jgi:hypothetical protein